MQLRLEKGVQVQCVVILLLFDCICSLGYVSNKGGILIYFLFLDNFQKWSSFRYGKSSRGGGDLWRGYKGCGRLDQKQIVYVQVWVQDIVEYEMYDGNELDGNFWSKD